jgi:hypothetical protein
MNSCSILPLARRSSTRSSRSAQLASSENSRQPSSPPGKVSSMTYQRRRKRSLQFEFLQRRETLSFITGEPFLIHPLAVCHRTVPFHANGTATLVGSPPSGTNGAFTATATGRASLLGQFKGLFSVAPSDNGGANVALDLSGKHRSTLQIQMTVLGSGSDGSPNDFQGTYAVIRGTRRLARATGGGAVTGIVIPHASSLTFNLQGTIFP